jgi:hypothetical protein
MRGSLLLAATAASACLLAGCGSSGSSGAPAAKASCGVIPAVLVNAALGTDYGDPTQVSADSGSAACMYIGTKAGTAVIRLQTDDTAAAFTAARRAFDTSGQTTTDRPGLGDEAYSVVKQMPAGVPAMNTLVTRKGSVEVQVTSTASIVAEQSLTRQVLTTLG